MLQIEAVKMRVKTLLLDHGIAEVTIETEPEGADCMDPRHKK